MIKLRSVAAAVVGMAIGLGGAGMPAALAIQPPAPPPAAKSMVSAVPAAYTPAVDDGDVRAIAKVGSNMVMGGNFTSVNGQARSRVAVFNPTTGALSGFNVAFNGEVDSIVPGPTADTAYFGGSFTQVGSAAIKNVALVNIASGTVVTSFVTPGFGSWGYINDMVKVGNRLVVGGTFTVVGGKAHGGIAALDATTGAVDNTWMNIQLAGHHNDTGSGAQGPVGPWNLDVSPSGDRIVAIGNFRTADGLARDQVAQISTTGATAVVTPDWQTNRYNPYCFNWAFDSYVRGVSYSPDGSYFIVASTGGGVANSLCDAVARFETYASGPDIQPTWVSETGGDTTWGTEVTDNAVYVGGHQRWGNNPYGSDTAGAGAVPRPGLMALDPVSGRPLEWNPGRNPPGKAVYAVLATSEGLWVGSNTDYVGNFRYLRKKIALFPYAGGAQLADTNVGALPGSVFTGGPVGGPTSTNVLYRVNAGGGAIASIDNGPDWADDSGSSSLHNTGNNAAVWGSGAAIDASVPSSTPSSVFDSERWDPNDANEMRWTFPIAAGTDVQVRVYLANRCGCTSGTGQRVFSVSANGSPWLSNYDIVADVGDQKGAMKSINLTVPASGQVTLDWTHVVENPLVNGIEIVRAGVATPPASASDVLTKVGLSSSAATSAPQAAPDGGVAWSNTRGAFMVGNKVFYALTDGYLYSRTFTGSSWGPAVQINPYHDPAWAGVNNHLGGTFDGNLPTLYGQIPNLTGMFYDAGRLYYTLYGDSRLFWRWFSPDSGIVDERTNVVDSSVDLRNVRGVFVAGGNAYFASRTDSTLYKAGWSGASITGSAVAISGPAIDGTAWASRSMFLFAGPPLNQAPTAAFGASCTGATCAFDASASTDSDGTVASYAWDFGDGSSGSGKTVSHPYTASGTYSVKLTVTDDQGATGTLTKPVPVTVPVNQAPTAAFGASCTGAPCAFDASASTDSDGTVASYAWDFGDGSSGSGKTVSHPYTASGTYSVKLTVTDDQGATGTLTKPVPVTVPVNQAPTAAFGASCTGATCAFDASASTDSDGTVASYAWDFGDGSSGSGKTVSHPYTASGTYSVKLTVTDDQGATGTLTKPVPVTVPVNQAPTAAFGASCTGATCAFDASASTDSDGTVASYAWDFGDGSSGSGKTVSHPYTASGTYSVKLTVTDDQGATGTLTKPVPVTVPTSSIAFVGASHSAPGAAKFKAAAVPTGTQAGDLMILVLSRPTVASFTGPTGVTGWTQVNTVVHGSVTSTVWRKTAVAGDLAGTVRFDDPSAYRLGTLELVAYRGADAASVRAVSAVDLGQSSHTTAPITVAAGDWVVSHWAGITSAVSPWTLPSGMVLRDHLEDPSGSYRYESLTADPGSAVSGAGIVPGVTATTVNKSDREVMWSIAFGQQ